MKKYNNKIVKMCLQKVFAYSCLGVNVNSHGLGCLLTL